MTMVPPKRTQVLIVGAGPAGLLLGQLLHKAGVDNVIVERQSGDYVLGRVRAGVLEQTTVDVLDEAGVSQRLHAEGLVHHGLVLLKNGERHRIDLTQHTDGRHVMVYGQSDVTRDLMAARAQAGLTTVYEAADARLHDIGGTLPSVSFTHGGVRHAIACDYIAGCDGFHGVSRASVDAAAKTEHEKAYPFGWLGVLTNTKPVSDEIVYGASERGFSLCSQRSTTRSRYYIQVPITDRAEQWSDDMFWAEFEQRLDDGYRRDLIKGPSIEKSIAPLRSFVCEPMRFGRLFLAGDAAHIVPPTGAKGMNLAVKDVKLLADAMAQHYRERSDAGINHYSDRALRRVWRVERFSWWFTTLLHRFDDDDAFTRKLRDAELDYLLHADAGRRMIAENYVGLPLNFGESQRS
jgi:p-hydroxybenzoate 3-monooxygenase